MNIEFYPEEKLRKQVLEIVSKHLDLDSYRIFFFGSRVKEDNFLVSDIDIGIEGPEELPVGMKLEIEEELDELPTLYKFDLIDFKKVHDGFKKETMGHVEYVK